MQSTKIQRLFHSRSFSDRFFSLLIPSTFCPICRRYSRHLTISSNNSLIDPITLSLSTFLLSSSTLRNSALQHHASFLLVRPHVGLAWTSRIVHSGPYFNINFLDGDTSFTSTQPRISAEAHHHPRPLLVPPPLSHAWYYHSSFSGTNACVPSI